MYALALTWNNQMSTPVFTEPSGFITQFATHAKYTNIDLYGIYCLQCGPLVCGQIVP